MRLGTVLLAIGALTVGACATTTDVRSTGSSAQPAGEQLPAVEPATTTSTVPGMRPLDLGGSVLLDVDLPAWSVIRPVAVSDEPTWEALDCPDMSEAWRVTGRAGVRSRGSIDGVAFRNTAVDMGTVDDARDLLDTVERVWNDCTTFETTTETFWSEPLAMPSSQHRTAGLAIGSQTTPNWALAYWQVGTMVVTLEVNGTDMWTQLDPLMTTLSARLDGTPAPISAAPVATTTTEPPPTAVPVIVAATTTVVPLPPTTTIPAVTTTTIEPGPIVFPPPGDDWTAHPLARLAPTPTSLGSGWEYRSGNRNEAAPPDPDDAIEGCDTPVPPMLDGYEVDYDNSLLEAQVGIMVGQGPTADLQTWIDALQALAECEGDPTGVDGAFDVVDVVIVGTDASVVIAGSLVFGDTEFTQVLVAAHVDGVLVAAFAVAEATGEQAQGQLIPDVTDIIDTMLAAR